MTKTYSFLEDTESVLERLGGNRALLARLVAKFGETYEGSIDALTLAMREGHADESYRIVHSIKGVAGNLGFGALYRASIALDKRMKAGEYVPESVEFAAFEDALRSVLGEIREMGPSLTTQ